MGAIGIVCQRNVCFVIEIPIFLRRIKGEVRTNKPAGQEKGLAALLQFPQIHNGLFGNDAVAIRIVNHFSAFIKKTVPPF